MRNLPWKTNATLDDPLYLTQLPFTDKSYTEHVQEVELIHMNGRMYDATLARFVSADPHIQAGAMIQSEPTPFTPKLLQPCLFLYSHIF